MNKIINKFLFVGDKFKPEMHLRQAGFIAFADHSLKINKKYNNQRNRRFKIY